MYFTSLLDNPSDGRGGCCWTMVTLLLVASSRLSIEGCFGTLATISTNSGICCIGAGRVTPEAGMLSRGAVVRTSLAGALETSSAGTTEGTDNPNSKLSKVFAFGAWDDIAEDPTDAGLLPLPTEDICCVFDIDAASGVSVSVLKSIKLCAITFSRSTSFPSADSWLHANEILYDRKGYDGTYGNPKSRKYCRLQNWQTMKMERSSNRKFRDAINSHSKAKAT